MALDYICGMCIDICQRSISCNSGKITYSQTNTYHFDNIVISIIKMYYPMLYIEPVTNGTFLDSPIVDSY